jgi:ankyrin repeat protein
MSPFDALLDAIQRRDPQATRDALAAGAPVNARDAYGRSPLSLACQIPGTREQRQRHEAATLAVIEALLEANADPADANGASEYPPLMAAVRWGTPAMVRRLLEARAPSSPSIVMQAIERCEWSVVQPLLLRAGGVDRGEVLRAMCAQGACSDEAASIARTLCKMGAKPGACGRDGVTAAHWAAYWADVPMLLVLIAAGADMGAKTGALWIANESRIAAGATPRAMLDVALDDAAPRFESVPPSRDSWAQLAEALGTTLDAWQSERRAAAQQPPAGKRKR